MNNDFKQLLPGFTMGLTRAAISHPFEILKIQSQIGVKNKFDKTLFRGIGYSLAANSMERGIQFYFFNKFKKENDSRLVSSLKSSLISTGISFPYNIILLKRVVSNNSQGFNKNIFVKSCSLEYSRNLIGSTLFLYSYDFYKTQTNLFFIPPVLATTNVWLITYPIDTIKNKIINDGQISLKKEGLRGLYKGIQYPLIRSLPSSIIGMWVYEKMLKWVS